MTRELHDWHLDEVGFSGSSQFSMVHGNFGGRANLKIGAGCLDLGEVRAFFGGGGGGVCGSASLKARSVSCVDSTSAVAMVTVSGALSSASCFSLASFRARTSAGVIIPS